MPRNGAKGKKGDLGGEMAKYLTLWIALSLATFTAQYLVLSES